jgi:hypothetical protein
MDEKSTPSAKAETRLFRTQRSQKSRSSNGMAPTAVSATRGMPPESKDGRTKIVLKNYLVCDFENFDFPYREMRLIYEEHAFFEFGNIGVSVTKNRA